MELSVSEAARLTGVSVRTLHYYDEIGLLNPSRISGAGYRYYDDYALERLQQILFFRELDFSLKDISHILSSPAYDRKQALQRQRELLCLKRRRIERLIGLVENTLKGEAAMSFDAFQQDELIKAKEQYAAEAKEKWGNSPAYAQCEKKTDGYSSADWEEATAEANKMIALFAQAKEQDPHGAEAQRLVEKWRAHISSRYYDCTPDILAGLGEMYTQDERFQKNLDRFGAGTAQFMSRAIQYYCAQRTKEG